MRITPGKRALQRYRKRLRERRMAHFEVLGLEPAARDFPLAMASLAEAWA